MFYGRDLSESMGARLFDQVVLCVCLPRSGWEVLHCLVGELSSALVTLQPRMLDEYLLSLESGGKGSGHVGQEAYIWESTFTLPHSNLDRGVSDL